MKKTKEDVLIIKIPNKLTGLERRKIIEEYPIRYAMKRFNYDIKKISEWLGYSTRHVRNKLEKVGIRSPETIKKEKELELKIKGLIEKDIHVKDIIAYQYGTVKSKAHLLNLYNKALDDFKREYSND